jgi:uncharacterized membrane protein YbhN (UPF0104 family)
MQLIKPLIKITLSAAMVAIVVHAFDVKGVAAHFMKVDVGTLVLVVAIALGIALLHTLRWMAVIDATGHRLTFKTALRLVLIGHFFNQALPSSVGGDAMRVWCAYRAGLVLSIAVKTVVVDRLLSLVSLLVLAAIGLPWLLDVVIDPVARWALSSVVLAGLAGAGRFSGACQLPRFALRWRAVRALVDVAKLSRKVLSHLRYAVPVVGLSIMSFLGFAVIVFAIARAMQIDVTVRDCVLLVPPVILVTVIPVSIAGWGLREGAMVVAFGFINVPAGAAFAMSVLFGLTLAVASLPGSLLWWLSGYLCEGLQQQHVILS